jgi:Protein of unknown function (DUF2800)
MAFDQTDKPSTFADDGTASHLWAAMCLEKGLDAEKLIGAWATISDETKYFMDEARADFIQMYLDDVRRRAIGGSLYVEQSVAVSDDIYGTADAVIHLNNHLIIEDLKYGTGEKVLAKDNPQLMLYALGALADAEMLGRPVEKVTGVICQPRLGHIDECTWTVAELKKFKHKAAAAVDVARIAMTNGPKTDIMSGAASYLVPGEKQCRWCRAKAQCPALSKLVADEVRRDFETIEAAPPLASKDPLLLAKAYGAVPLIEDWCRAVRFELGSLVEKGEKVFGPDNLPYKFVEGRSGGRTWTDPTVAEAALVGQLADKAYQPQKVITAPVAAKLLDKKATKALWKDIFEPIIKKLPGKPVLVAGSDPRPPYSGAATADDFAEDLSE